MLSSALRLGLACLALASSTLAVNVVSNPGFETGSVYNFPPGWTLYSGGGFIFNNAHSGSNNFLSVSGSNSPDVFGQTVSGLTSGVVYDLSFYAFSNDISDYDVTVSINGGKEVAITLATSYSLQTVSFTAADSNVFKITSSNAFNGNNFDDFSIAASSVQPSGSPDRRKRRAVEAKRDQLLLSNPYCPARLTACPVKRVAFGEKVDLERDGYECLDTQTEYESCGGCATTGEGVDCSDLADQGARPDSITCSAGRCVVYKCQPGFALLSDGSGCKAITGRSLRL